jgi:DNA topoisomerase-1
LRAIRSGKAASVDPRHRQIVDDAEDALGVSLTGDETDNLADALGDYAGDSGEAAFAQIGGVVSEDEDTIFNQINARAAAWASERAAELVSQIDETTRDAVRNAVGDGLASGKTADEIADDIEDLGAFGEKRSSLIANTEIANANSEGALVGYKEARDNGVNVMKAWMITSEATAGTHEGEACDVCQANADEGPIDLDEDFVGGVSAPSQHPFCRCVLVPVILPDEKAARFHAVSGDELEKYDPDQSRDERGRWTSGGAVYDADSKQWRMSGGGALPPHLEGVRIPPAWSDVRIATNADSDLLATGKDAKGRSQSIYSDKHWADAAASKYARVEEMQDKFSSIMRENETTRESGDSVRIAHADATETIAKMGIRPGSDDDTGAEKKAYGATTLLGQHVVQTDSGTRLQFVGKKGVSLDLPVDDENLAKMLTARAEAAGPDGKIFGSVTDASLRDYVHSLDGGDFKVKDFRTRLANDVAGSTVSSMTPPSDESSYKRSVFQVAKAVSAKLGNTPTIALQSYINPAVFAGWRMASHV